MASTYSTNLRLELITTGEQQGTWGSTTNKNLGSLLEQAISGWQDITVDNTGVSETTLVMTDGELSTARNMIIELSGAITATRNVICPTNKKMYTVRNATTGGFPVTLKVAGQTGVSIPFGQTMIVYVDGTDVRQASLPVSRTNVAQISSIELGAASDTTITRSAAGVIAVEGVTVPLNSITSIHTAQQIELGNASDTTITRSVAGVIAVEGGVVPKENRANTFSALQTISGGGLTVSSGGITVSSGGIAVSGAGSVLVRGTGGLGYGLGSGGSVIQTANKSNTVTLNNTSGRITTTNDALAAGASAVFLFANSTISATDVLIVNVVQPSDSSYTAYYYEVKAFVFAVGGNAIILLKNVFNTSLSDAVIINFAVIKGVTS